MHSSNKNHDKRDRTRRIDPDWLIAALLAVFLFMFGPASYVGDSAQRERGDTTLDDEDPSRKKPQTDVLKVPAGS